MEKEWIITCILILNFFLPMISVNTQYSFPDLSEDSNADPVSCFPGTPASPALRNICECSRLRWCLVHSEKWLCAVRREQHSSKTIAVSLVHSTTFYPELQPCRVSGTKGVLNSPGASVPLLAVSSAGARTSVLEATLDEGQGGV